MTQTFEDVTHDWESLEGWKFADRRAERLFFFQAGMNAMNEAVADRRRRLTSLALMKEEAN